MIKTVTEAIDRYAMLKKGDCVIVGVSGGADSCSLLHVLISLKDEYGITVRACHINHNLRGEESDSDEKYVRKLCSGLGVELDVFSLDIPSAAKKHESTEETARRLRYARFSELIERYGAKFATAHTASDNAETVLMNLVRGTGTKGLAGIPPVRERFIRPLIFCTRAMIQDYCEKNGIYYVTDSTNLCDDYTRNRIRHNVIPLLEQFNPSFLGSVTRMTCSVRDDTDYLEALAEKYREECMRAGKLDSKKLDMLPLPIRTRIIVRELKENDVEPSSLRIAQCLEIIAKGMGKVNLCKDRFAYVRKKLFYVQEEIQEYRNR